VNNDDLSQYSIDTLALRANLIRTQFGEHSEAIFPTISFVYKDAAEAAARFAGEAEGYMYSRFTNPSVDMFEQRLAAMEGGEACIAFASGMAAIHALVMGVCQSGDHVVTSGAVFGTTLTLFNQLMPKFGVQCTVVDSTDPQAWRAAMRPNTKLVFCESPSNPTGEVFDIAAIAEIAHTCGAKECLFTVDNCFCTPVLQLPLKLGADVVMHSATKHLDGQGRVMGGAIVGSAKLCKDTLYAYLRTTGATLSAFNAWVLIKGLETLPIRMRAHSENALALAQWLEKHPAVEHVYYPFLTSSRHHALAKKQQTGGGAVLSFAVKGARKEAWSVVDATKMVSITANLGDVRTTLTHPYTTTHARMPVDAKARAGIGENLLRVSVGLEDVEDLKKDFGRGLDALLNATNAT
jgi:O-succinylhomoserine sulfhydrylase